MNIVHITTRQAWMDATQAGRYVSPSLKSEGFIHCSTYAQALPVAEKFYKGQTGLVLLMIDPARLASGLKWEPPSDGASPSGLRADEAFPHVYGPINLDAIIQILDFGPGPDDHFKLPPDLLADR